MPASNATTTNGVWFALPDGSPVWKSLTGQPLTLATRIRMGVGSGDLANSTSPLYISAGQYSTNGGFLHYSFISGVVVNNITSYDGINTAALSYATWPRNSIINRITQVSADGTRFRVGCMIEGTQTTIQWSPWVNYDSSFNPSTLYRLMLGYNNAYPMWFSRIAVWNKQMDDSAILEALNG